MEYFNNNNNKILQIGRNCIYNILQKLTNSNLTINWIDFKSKYLFLTLENFNFYNKKKEICKTCTETKKFFKLFTSFIFHKWKISFFN